MLPQVNVVRAKHGDFLSFFERAGIAGVLTAHGVWDELTIGVAKLLIDQCSRSPVVLDIGANMGTFAVPIAKHIAEKAGVLHCFEPQRIVFYQLCGNVFMNRLDNVYVHNVALSAFEGDREIDVLNYHKAWNIGSYSLFSERNEQEVTTKRELCKFSRLDSLLPADTKITLIKLDVEGMESDVLRGAMMKIQSDGFPPILFESLKEEARATEAFDILTNAGYRCSQYAEEDWLAQHPHWDSEIHIENNHGVLSFARLR